MQSIFSGLYYFCCKVSSHSFHYSFESNLYFSLADFIFSSSLSFLAVSFYHFVFTTVYSYITLYIFKKSFLRCRGLPDVILMVLICFWNGLSCFCSIFFLLCFWNSNYIGIMSPHCFFCISLCIFCIFHQFSPHLSFWIFSVWTDFNLLNHSSTPS